MIDQALQHCAVIGAAGKMGRGIAQLILQLMTQEKLRRPGEDFRLDLIDQDIKGLEQTRKYLRAELQRFAEKNINSLRALVKDDPKLISNEEVIQAFINAGMDCLWLSDQLQDASLVFEAIVEDVEAKVELFQQLKTICSEQSLFFSNTSSIPIQYLADKSGLQGRLVGFHFYNPPPLQSLMESVYPSDSKGVVVAKELAERLGKVVVEANDVAGFIGNGFLMREIQFACSLAEEGGHAAIALLDELTRDQLHRPMGIFQLADYVGLDVCVRIARIMTDFLGKSVTAPLVEQMVAQNILGGQNPDGSQKEGFFRYEGRKPVAVYDQKEYRPLPEGKAPPEWKQRFLEQEAVIVQKLVEDGVAKSLEDVKLVLEKGFHH